MINIKTKKVCFALFGLVWWSSESFAADCTPAPDCNAQGYNMSVSDCSGTSYIKCPFNSSKVFCYTSNASVSASVGDILYGDGTTSSQKLSGKTAVGVVLDPILRLAVALTDVKQDGTSGSEEMKWSSENCHIPGLQNCPDAYDYQFFCDVDGRTNTDAILATNGGCSGTTYAANAVNSYEPKGCSAAFCKKGKWYLPSARELRAWYNSKDIINKSLLSVSGDENADIYWTSNEEKSFTSVVYEFYRDFITSWEKNGSYEEYVRPFVKY